MTRVKVEVDEETGFVAMETVKEGISRRIQLKLGESADAKARNFVASIRGHLRPAEKQIIDFDEAISRSEG